MHARNALPALFSSLAIVALIALSGCGSTTTTGVGNGQSCKLTSDCPTGQTCTGGFCITKTVTADAIGQFDVGGDASTSTDLDSTSPGSDGASPGTDAITMTDTGSGNAKGAACQACKVDADCGDEAFQCITLLNGTFCAKKCGSANDCPAAFKCDKADTKAANNNCLPPNYSCDGCLVTPCDPGQSCVTATGKCAVVKQQCDECTAQADCADGLKCIKLGATKVCAPTCDNGAACPDKSACQKTVVGNICAFQASTCCYGANCNVADACAQCADKCFGGACVDCLTDAQCSGGKCDSNSHTCITSGACQAPTPIKLANGSCVECTNDTHCASSTVGPKCDLASHACAKSTVSNECAACTGPYPGCVQINGVWSCVECTTDADCAAKNAGTCSGTTYSCSGTVNVVGPTSGTCKKDSDCQNAGTTAFTLACDTGSGLCYDTTGKCDGVVAFCNATKGSSCVQPSAVAGGIPGLPGGTGTGTTNPNEGVCTCGASSSGGGTSSGNPMCAMLAPTCNCATNPTDPACSPIPGLVECCASSGSGGTNPLGGFLDILSCQTPTPNAPDCFGGQLSCTCDLASSLGALTGGSTTKAPKNCAP